MRRIGGLAAFAIAMLAGWIVLGLVQRPPGDKGRGDARLVASLRHLDAEAEAGEAVRMQALFPEGYVFTRVLHGLAWAAVAADSTLAPDLRAEASEKAREAAADLDTSYGRSPFPATLDPPHGAFYAGWTLWLDVERLRAVPNDRILLASFHQRADDLATALTRSLDASGSPFLPSYAHLAWPADGLVGVAALAQHDRLFEPRYTPLIRRWLDAAADRTDPASGLLAHAARVPDGAPMGGLRGSSQALMLRFMAEVDPDLGRQMFEAFRERFVTTRFGLPVVLEYPVGTEGEPDIDSGPLPMGVSMPGTVVAIGAARRYGDEALARDLSQTVEAFGFPLVWRGRRMYALGALPVGDAFLAWARTAEPLPPPRRRGGQTR
ncbi:MAG: hypothetical protein AAGI52_11360 [Bacteroidota bacterium]